MDEKTILKFKDEEGNVVELEAVAEIYLDEQKYLILAPLDDNSADEYVYRVDVNKEGQEELNAIESDEEFMKVKKEYKNLLYNEGGKNE
ncbi:DUF1292 domain-containing protein [Proteiniclasticum ruminis]|uniref:Uncharacterized protein n=1 Tax=Proteiniclasticum ruminis TaxID=398199 RepID=A0A1G8PJJ9_9CLOT|nr:DUF1292 domain-containing protein [Proteiniclasticum ruminis]MBP9921343.1 DUF1292 domain-containing protein [Proteiniclasticum sp.]SDI92711.1 Protein of unknown function [Proteiniclasticum ruminis]